MKPEKIRKAHRDGVEGERAARDYLEGCGYEFLAANYRFGHREIDLVMRDGGTIVFVEVKTRSPDALVAASLAVDRNKQRLLFSAAAHFLYTRSVQAEARFDIVCVRTGKGGKKTVSEHVRNAFTPYGG